MYVFSVALWNSVFWLCVGNLTLSMGSLPRLSTGRTMQPFLATVFPPPRGSEKRQGDRCRCPHQPKLQPTGNLRKMASPLFSLFCIPREQTSHSLPPSCNSHHTLRFLNQKPSKSVVFKQLLLLALLLKFWRKEITIHKLISQQIEILHLPCRLLSLGLCPRSPPWPLHTISKAFLVFIILCLKAMWLFPPNQIVNSLVALLCPPDYLICQSSQSHGLEWGWVWILSKLFFLLRQHNHLRMLLGVLVLNSFIILNCFSSDYIDVTFSL